MTKKNNFGWTMTIIVGVLLVGALVYVLGFRDTETPMLKIAHYYDKNGNEIEPGSLIAQETIDVGGTITQGVYFIDLEVFAQNDDTVPLEVSMVGGTPPEFLDAFQSPPYIVTLPVGDSYTWQTELIDITQFADDGTQTFSITLTGSSPVRETSTNGASVDFTVTTDPQAAFSVTLSSALS